MSMCLRCDNECPATRPYCVDCTFIVRAQIEDGLRKLALMLEAWAAFRAWEATHP